PNSVRDCMPTRPRFSLQSAWTRLSCVLSTHFRAALSFFFSLVPRPPGSTLFPYTTLFRSAKASQGSPRLWPSLKVISSFFWRPADRKSTRLNSSHVAISYAVFCLKKKKLVLQGAAGGAIAHEAPAAFRTTITQSADPGSSG